MPTSVNTLDHGVLLRSAPAYAMLVMFSTAVTVAESMLTLSSGQAGDCAWLSRKIRSEDIHSDVENPAR